MKGVTVYHQIKALCEQYSYRECARRLGISVNTVQKYAQMSMAEAAACFQGNRRGSQFDEAHAFIVDQLDRFPKLKSPKLLRKIRQRYPHITAKERALRAYLIPIRKEIVESGPGKIRYHERILDMQPGVQVQVDIGEEWVLRNEDGSRFKAWFVSFVFSYSRKNYVTFRGRVYDTDSFIDAHIAAFRYFGGIAEEYVYDQTKLVVINERFREVWLNERFHDFAVQCGFRVHVCEGYDPESKGKVENSIRYIKGDFLYGDYFEHVEAVNKAALVWLESVANARIHSVTQRRPAEMFAEEIPLLRPLPDKLLKRPCRWADKTGLISFLGNRYSVPYRYQRQQVWVEALEGKLVIRDRLSAEELARHALVQGSGRIIKHREHYEGYRKTLEALIAEAEKLFEALPSSGMLITRLAADTGPIARHQLHGLIKLYPAYPFEIWAEGLPLILQLPRLRMSVIEALLKKFRERKAARAAEGHYPQKTAATSEIDRPLDVYMEVLNHD